MHLFNKPRITKEDLEYCKVEYFQDDNLVDVIHDKFECLSEAVNRCQKNFNYMAIFSQNTAFYGEYQVSSNKTYRKVQY